jgi:hypothetical protein
MTEPSGDLWDLRKLNRKLRRRPAELINDVVTCTRDLPNWIHYLEQGMVPYTFLMDHASRDNSIFSAVFENCSFNKFKSITRAVRLVKEDLEKCLSKLEKFLSITKTFAESKIRAMSPDLKLSLDAMNKSLGTHFFLQWRNFLDSHQMKDIASKQAELREWLGFYNSDLEIHSLTK